MEQSENIKELAEALNAFQAELVTVGKTAANPFFKSKYAPLDEIMLKAQPVLAKHGLSITQQPSHLEGKPALTSQLMHISGQWQRSTMPLLLAKEDPQGLGSAITYARRYSYAAVLGIVIDEDDDGNRGSRPAPQAKAAPTVRLATDIQKSQIKAFANALGIPDEHLARELHDKYGVKNPARITYDEAINAIESMK